MPTPDGVAASWRNLPAQPVARSSVLHERRREVERLLGSKNDCSPTLHAKGTALIRTHERLIAALDELLSVAERMHGGDPSLDPEEWYAARDYARIVLNGGPHV